MIRGRPSSARGPGAASNERPGLRADYRLLHVVVIDGRRRVVRAPGLVRWLTRVAPSSARGEVTIVLTGARQVHTLNRRYRGVDRPTDVLSFPATVPPEAGSLGDIVIARDVARRQAARAGHDLSTELRILALHGLLHLLGYDHENGDQRMARVERRLRRLGGLREGLIERTGKPARS